MFRPVVHCWALLREAYGFRSDEDRAGLRPGQVSLGNVDTDKCSPHGERSKFYWFFVDRPHSFSLFSISSRGGIIDYEVTLCIRGVGSGSRAVFVCDFEFIINLNVIHLYSELLFS